MVNNYVSHRHVYSDCYLMLFTFNNRGFQNFHNYNNFTTKHPSLKKMMQWENVKLENVPLHPISLRLVFFSFLFLQRIKFPHLYFECEMTKTGLWAVKFTFSRFSFACWNKYFLSLILLHVWVKFKAVDACSCSGDKKGSFSFCKRWKIF